MVISGEVCGKVVIGVVVGVDVQCCVGGFGVVIGIVWQCVDIKVIGMFEMVFIFIWQVVDVGGIKFSDQGQMVGVYYLVEEFDQGELSLGDFEVVVVVYFLVIQVGVVIFGFMYVLKQIGVVVGFWVLQLQIVVDQFKCILLDWYVWMEVVFCVEGLVVWSCGVDVDVVQVDIFWVFDEV